MSNVAIVRSYFERFFSGKADHSKVREWLTDDFTFRDPLMSADGADDYVSQLKALGTQQEMYAEVREIVEQGPFVSALVVVRAPVGRWRSSRQSAPWLFHHHALSELRGHRRHDGVAREGVWHGRTACGSAGRGYRKPCRDDSRGRRGDDGFTGRRLS